MYVINNLLWHVITLFVKTIFTCYHKIHPFSLIKIFPIYAHVWTEYAERSNLFNTFVTNEIFEILFTKRKLIR